MSTHETREVRREWRWLSAPDLKDRRTCGNIYSLGRVIGCLTDDGYAGVERVYDSVARVGRLRRGGAWLWGANDMHGGREVGIAPTRLMAMREAMQILHPDTPSRDCDCRACAGCGTVRFMHRLRPVAPGITRCPVCHGSGFGETLLLNPKRLP